MNVTHLLVHTLYLARRTGMGATGVPTYGTPFSVAARVELGAGVEGRGKEGEASTAIARIITETIIYPEDRLWLPTAAMAAGDYTDATKAHVPGQAGVQPVTGLDGAVSYYLTTV